MSGSIQEAEAVAPLRHPPIVLDASLDAVIRTLERFN